MPLTLTLTIEETEAFSAEPTSFSLQEAHRIIEARARALAESDMIERGAGDGWGACEISAAEGYVIKVVYYGEPS